MPSPFPSMDPYLDSPDWFPSLQQGLISPKRCEAIGLQVPKVTHPKLIDDAGRQWTDEGEDKPTRRE